MSDQKTQDLSGLRREGNSVSAAERVPMPRRRVATRLVLPIVAIGAFLGLLAWAGRDLLGRTIDVRVIPVVMKSLGGAPGPGVTTQAAGWVEPDPFPIHVPALTEGVVAEVLVLDGERVEAGQVVARLVPDDARLSLRKAEAMAEVAARMVTIADARVAAANVTWENAVERRRAVASADADLAAARADADAASRDADAENARASQTDDILRRGENDLRSGAIPEIDVVKMRREAEAAHSAAQAADSRRISALTKIASAAASLAAATSNATLRVEETAERAIAVADAGRARADARRADAERDEAALRVARLDVRAPVAGVVMHRLVEPGMMVPSKGRSENEAHIVSLYDPTKLQVRTDVPLAEAAKVGVGTKARIVVEVLPDRVFEGEITRVVNLADIQKNTIQFKVRITAPAPEIKPDMLARVQFLLAGTVGGSAETQRLFAPERLLGADADGDETAWVVNAAEGRAERRVVERGSWKSDGWVEILSGLTLGDKLIEPGAETLTPGCRVRVVGESGAAR